ncbi:cystathionine gamma-lyase [Loa loa]|uniref:cystathionine gamma-lyase n=1 Tax=Loa loa TaxID=7209 RepID=A0A1I7V6R2_LOALO|nr:cystathionine gamma-lyase [Loa loa]EFO17954.1 cystathionine gamma-lyase [Loa loa]
MANHQEHFPHFGTNATHIGQEPEQWDTNQIIPPISLSTTFKQLEPGKPKKYDYSRAGNPSRDVLEKCLASLEEGEYCRVYSSGLAATMAITNTLKSGDHIVCCDDVYGGTQRYFRKVSVLQHSLEISFVDMTDLKAFSQALKSNTKMIWLETPSNPLLKIVDIAAVVEITKTFRSDILMIVDNTFMSPYFQRPLSLGADAVLHSITKYINGHSDVVMGAVITNIKSLDEALRFQQLAVGAVPSPFDCFLVNRGVKTLHVRMRAHMVNAIQIATFLESNPRIGRIFYPELQSHPQHEIHKKQTRGMSGMMSFYLKGGLEESQEFLSSLKIFTLAESLGGFESLAELPAAMTHASVPLEDRIKLGISDNLIRISVGIEDVEDLIQDLDQALKKAIPKIPV